MIVFYKLALLQILAASQAGRDVCYFTFGEEALQQELYECHTFLKQKGLLVGKLEILHYLY